MQCPVCRTENDPGAKYCTECGASLSVNAPSVQPKEDNPIPQAPSSYPQQAPYPQQPYPQPNRQTVNAQPATVQTTRKKGGTVVLIVILAIILLIVGILGLTFLLKAKHSPGGAGRKSGSDDAAVTEAADDTTAPMKEETKPADPSSSDETATVPMITSEAVSGAAENDFSVLYGVWTSQSGDWEIYILPDGNYYFSRPDGYYSGTVRSEKSGYGMYLKDGSRLLTDSALSFEGDDRSCLTYRCGDGLVYLYHNAGEYEGYDYNLVTLYWGQEAYEIFRVYDRYQADQTDSPAVMLVGVDYPVTDFKVLDLELKDVSQAGELSFHVSTLYEQAVLLPRRPLELSLSLAGDIPNRGISFTDPNGNVRRYYISVSGYDGTYSLTEF